MKNLPFIGALLFLASSSASQADVTTPHTFTAGTPALASQVNENFQAHRDAINARALRMILKSNGIEIGSVIDLPSASNISSNDHQILIAISNKGFLFAMDFYNRNLPALHGLFQTDSQVLWYESDDCSGQGYYGFEKDGSFYNYSAYGFLLSGYPILVDVNSPPSYAPYYTSGMPTTIQPNSRTAEGEQEGCQVSWSSPMIAWPVLPNNPAVTGIQFLPPEQYKHSQLENLTIDFQ